MSNSYDRVLSVISKKPELRQEFEIQGLLPWLRKKSQLFATLKTDCLKDIVRNCGVQSFKKDDVIIRQGEIGECFYIILGGKISIYIINKDNAQDKSEENAAFAAIGSLTNDGKLDRSKLGNFVTHLGSGVPFGEVALVSDDAIRTASIIAEDDNTDLLVVDRTLYNRAVRDVLAAEFREKKEFIKSNSLFKNWIPKYKKQLAMAMYKETYPYDAVLVRQGDQVSNIYFVISGQVEVRTDTSFHPFQYPRLYELLEDEREKLIKQKKKPPDADQPSSPLRKRDSSKFTKLCYLGRNESVGEVEVLMDMDTYMSTAICAERTEVLVLEMKHYERLFVKRHQRTIDQMRRNLEIKLQSRASVLKERDEILVLKLIQTKLHMIHNPPPTNNEKKKKETSVQSAEKMFFSHQGPLLDIDGPGSVFYMIRAREKSKLKRSMLQKDKSKSRPGQGQNQGQTQGQGQGYQNGHLHSIRLPQQLVMAAQIAGASELKVEEDRSVEIIDNDLNDNVDGLEEFPVFTEQNIERAVERALINENKQSSENPATINRLKSAVSQRANTEIQHSEPKSVRRIKSAVKHKFMRNKDDSEDGEVFSKNDYDFKYLPSPRPITMLENYKVDANLKRLEEKVEEWLKKADPKAGTNVSKLRRLHAQDIEPPPKQGNKIVIRRRLRAINIDATHNTGFYPSSTPSERSDNKSIYNKYSARPVTVDPLDKFKILLSSS